MILTGILEWTELVGDYIRKVTVNKDGDIIIKKSGSNNLVKYDSIGNIIGEIEIEPEEANIINFMDTFADGAILVGRSNGHVTKIMENIDVPKQSEIEITNNRKEFKIRTEVEAIDGEKGGSISGENIKPYEVVKYGESNTKEIKMIPDEGYEIISITVNGEEYKYTIADDGSYIMPQFTNVTEDKTIVVKYASKTNKIIINKVDAQNNELKLQGATFKLDQIEERTEPENVLGEMTDNGDTYVVVDETKEVTDALGEFTQNGTYYFVENEEGQYVPTNSSTYQKAHGGTAGIGNSTANSYIKIDLSNKTGKYAVKVNATISSEIMYDYGYATITEGTEAPTYNQQAGRFIYATYISSNDYVSQLLEGGKIYYLHFGYMKDPYTDGYEDQFVINSVNLYEAENKSYNFVANGNGGYESNNQGLDSVTANSYIPIDLTGLTGKYNLTVNANVSSQTGDYGYATVTTTTTAPMYYSITGRFIYISGTDEEDITPTDYTTVLQGGQMYYLHLGYYKNATTSSGDDKFTINNISVTLNDSELYHTEVTTNSEGQGITQIPFGKYAITEVETVDGYELLEKPVIIDFRESGNTVVTNENNVSATVNEAGEFVIANNKLGKVIVHHYLKDKDGTYTKTEVAEDDLLEGKKDEQYTTSPHLDLNKYELEKDTEGKYVVPGNATGTFTSGEIEVTYYYEEKEIPLIVHHYIEGTETLVPLKAEGTAQDEYFSGEEGSNYTTSAIPEEQLSDKYELVAVPENAEGKYSGDEVIVTYYYKKVERQVVINKYDEDGKEPLTGVKFTISAKDTPQIIIGEYTTDSNGQIITNLEAGNYIATETEVLEGYDLPKNSITEFSVTKDQNQITLNITNTKTKGTVITHYYIEDTQEQVPSNVQGKTIDDVIQTGNIGEIWATKEADNVSSDYEFVRIEGNTSGEYTEGTQEIIYYYKLKDTSVIVHHYIMEQDGTPTETKVPSKEGNGSVVDDEIILGKINDSYDTNPSTNIAENYAVVEENPEKAEGTMTAEQIVVTYYYKLKEPKITAQNITKTATPKIENLTDEITYNISYTTCLEDYIGDAEVTVVDTLPYVIDTEKSDLAGGTYDEVSKTITWRENISDINSFENKNNEIIINKTIKVVYEGINQNTTSIENKVTGKIETKNPEKESEEIEATGETTTGFTVNIPVSKVWEDDSDKLGQRPTRVVFKLTGSDGSEYTLELAKPGTAGSTTTQDSANPNKWNDIFENLPKYDSNNEEIVYTLTEEEKTEGDLKYYDSVVTDKTVTNTSKYGKVTVHHYIMNTDGTTTTTRVPDTNGAEIADVVIEGKEGDEYTTEEAKNINEKYELVTSKLPANATGTIEKYNEEKPQEVIYYYRLKPGKVLINYLEKDSNQVLSAQERITGNVDDEYNTDTEHRKETITYNGRTYTLVSDSGNKTGRMTVTDINVTYYYLQNTKATVRYVERNPETHEIVKDLEEPYTQEGLVGDKFVTNKKAFVGYKLVESPEKTTINMTKEDQTLIYYYEPVYTGLIENHIDDKTGKILETETHEIQVGEDYNIPSKEFEGYDLVESKLPENAEGTMGEELVTVNYYYIKKAVLEVNYIDKLTGEPLADQVVDDTKHEGDNYSTEEKVFENYDMIKVDGNKEGTLAVETDEQGNITNNRTVVTYYYSKKSAGVEEHHIDILTGEYIEEPTLHEGHVGDEYDIKAKEFLSYKLVEADEEGNSMLPTNSIGTMTEEKIVVNYYYNQPAKVIVHYVEKATGKELEETNPETGELQNSQVIIEGQKDDDYTATAKEFEYYTLIEKPQEEQGKMKVEIVKDEEGNDVVNNTIELYYYYEAKPFNIGVEKEITGIIVNGERRESTNGKLEKVEIYRKSTEETSVQVEYKIKVSNTGEVSGNATIEENIPEGMSLANNDGTWEEQEGKLIKVIPELGAGETKEYTVLLNWEQTGENMGEKANEVKLVETGNVPGFVDNNDKDNTSNANVIISVETGELPIGLLVALVALVGLETITLRYAVVLTKRQKKVNKK